MGKLFIVILLLEFRRKISIEVIILPAPIVERTLNPNAPVLEDDRDQVDEGFFAGEGPRAMTKNGVFGGRNVQYGFQRSVGDDGRVLSRKERKLNEG